MAATTDMVQVRVGAYTFKVRAKDLETYLKTHEDAEVIGGYQTKAAPKAKAKTTRKISEEQE